MSFNDKIFTKIGQKLAASNSSIHSDIQLDSSTETNLTLSNSSKTSSSISNIAKNTIHFSDTQIYNFEIVYYNDNIQIKVINLLTMEHYSDLLDTTFIKELPYIRSLKILYNMLKDAINKINLSVVNLVYKLADNTNIQLNLEYTTDYDKYVISFNIPIQELSIAQKQSLLLEKLVKSNFELQNRIILCEKKINELENNK